MLKLHYICRKVIENNSICFCSNNETRTRVFIFTQRLGTKQRTIASLRYRGEEDHEILHTPLAHEECCFEEKIELGPRVQRKV